jgi:diguanylate cyclase (GGDEF)-like protein
MVIARQRSPASLPRAQRREAISDTFGHEAGDLLLRELGRVLHENVRKSDIACRSGGEEFALVLLDTSQEASRQHIEKIRSQVKELQPPLS